MPNYKNHTNQEVTVFVDNAIKVHFDAGETKFVKQSGLDEKYRAYISRLPDPTPVTEEAEKGTKKAKKTIQEVKEPAPQKVLIDEPAKNFDRPGTSKLSEGYTTVLKEVTVATSKK